MKDGRKACGVVISVTWLHVRPSHELQNGYVTSVGRPKNHNTDHAAEWRHRGGTPSRNVKIVPVGCLSATRVSSAIWTRRFRTDSEQFQVNPRQSSDFGVFMTFHTDEAVCTPSALMFHLIVFLFEFAVRGLLFGSVVLHWYRRHVTGVELSVRHSAAVDLGRNGSDEKTWTTVPSTQCQQRERTRTPRAGTWSYEA